MTHSATPWQLCHHLESPEKDQSCKCGYRGGIWGDAGEILVCEMRNCDLHEGHEMTPVGDRDTQIANAHFIVKACNSHDRLVEALEFIRDGYERGDINHVDYRVGAYKAALDALSRIGVSTVSSQQEKPHG